MPFQPVPGVAQFNIRASLGGETVENVIHYIDVVNAIWSASQLATYAQNIGVAWRDTVMPNLSDDYDLLEVEARDLSIEGGFVASWVPPEPVSGSLIQPALPNNIALCLTKLTARSGRSYRGRIYICGLVETQVTGNLVLNASADAIRTAVKNIFVLGGASTIGGVVVSRENQGTPRASGVATVITDVVLRDYRVDTQRRRLPGA